MTRVKISSNWGKCIWSLHTCKHGLLQMLPFFLCFSIWCIWNIPRNHDNFRMCTFQTFIWWLTWTPYYGDVNTLLQWLTWTYYHGEHNSHGDMNIQLQWHDPTAVSRCRRGRAGGFHPWGRSRTWWLGQAYTCYAVTNTQGKLQNRAVSQTG